MLDAATPAPTRLNTRAWLELDGMPKYQVRRFQAIAESSAAITSCWVTALGSMIPLPTVEATAVPDSAPKKFKMAAIKTA